MTKIDDELHQRALQVPIQKISWNAVNRYQLDLLVRRDDLIDSSQSGNKFYKLFYNLDAAKKSGFTQVLSFGGAFSNHLYALAAAGRERGLTTIGVVRGERPACLSPTLRDAEAWGMKLHFVSRDTYRLKSDARFLADLRQIFGDFYAIPEGGANEAGVRGSAVIGHAIDQQLNGHYSCVCAPCGTGNTLAGIAAGLPESKTAIGFSVLKGAGDLGVTIAKNRQSYLDSLPDDVDQGSGGSWRLISGYHGGGYGKKLPSYLDQFWRSFENETGLLLDPVYSLKMFWGISQLAAQHYWSPGSRIVAVHTGGLQGRRGFNREKSNAN